MFVDIVAHEFKAASPNVRVGGLWLGDLKGDHRVDGHDTAVMVNVLLSGNPTCPWAADVREGTLA